MEEYCYFFVKCRKKVVCGVLEGDGLQGGIWGGLQKGALYRWFIAQDYL
jgi:hypothetical protein